MARRNANIAPSHISREVHLELISWAYEIGWQQGRPKTMQLRTRMECVGSLPGLCKGVHRKKTETRRKIVKGSRKACWDDGCTATAQDSGGCQRLNRPGYAAELLVP
ncbi:hypothetical protein B296_00019517 [Ensete ventricosum]|uniref:Uncharacterized protein n=1 Tax=Ensete ventricosum TaxID=4639 RepID=A0A426YFZ2_ENSVE|nr:hypothetical protein B296_00019517 [Ensete ventricosum]